jgi:hypothetical protein
MNRDFARVALSSCMLLGCDEDRAPLDLGELVTPERECVEVVHEALDLGGPVLEFSSDAAGSAGGWALVSTVVEGNPVLAIVRVPASPEEPSTEPIVVADDPFDAPLFDLRAGSELGTAWLLRAPDSSQAGQVVLTKLAPGEGVVTSNDHLANFPPEEDEAGCPDRWWRQLLLIEGRPYLLAIPDCTEGPGISLQLLALDEQSLEFLINWTLSFDPCADIDAAGCAQLYAYRFEAIVPGQSTHRPDHSLVQVGFTQARVYQTGLPDEAPVGLTSDIVLLDLRVHPSGPEARLVTFRDIWIHLTPFPRGPVELAQDYDWLQIFVPNLLDRTESALIRFDPLDEGFQVAGGADVLPHAGEGTLIQLARESAMLGLDELGRLYATRLADVPVWGSFTPQPIYERDDLIGFESAGPGMLLLHRAEHPEQLLHVACMPEQDE